MKGHTFFDLCSVNYVSVNYAIMFATFFYINRALNIIGHESHVKLIA